MEAQPESIALRKTITLAFALSAVLSGAVAVAAEPDMDPSKKQQAQAVSQADSSRPASTTASPEADVAADTSNTKVGSEKSNVDKDSSSGSYYPNSAGTVGDTPADPKSTSVSPDVDDDPTGPTNQWGNIDSDGDEKLTHGEFRTWHESHKAKTDADPDANTSSGPNDRTR